MDAFAKISGDVCANLFRYRQCEIDDVRVNFGLINQVNIPISYHHWDIIKNAIQTRNKYSMDDIIDYINKILHTCGRIPDTSVYVIMSLLVDYVLRHEILTDVSLETFVEKIRSDRWTNFLSIQGTFVVDLLMLYLYHEYITKIVVKQDDVWIYYKNILMSSHIYEHGLKNFYECVLFDDIRDKFFKQLVESDKPEHKLLYNIFLK
jgi:hypothetical protein